MSTKKPVEPQVIAAWIGAGGVILAAIIAGTFAYFHLPIPPPTSPTPTPGGYTGSPATSPTPTPIWAFTISHDSAGSFSNQPGYYYTTVTAHVVNQASDGNTHDLLASAFHLYPVINGKTDFSLMETLSSPSPSTDFSIAHNTSMDITLTFLVPYARNRFDLHLDGVGPGWAYSVTPP